MARKITYVVTETATGAPKVALEDIPDEIKDEIEEMYDGLKLRPNGRFRIDFDSKEERLMYEGIAKAYAANRPNGPIIFRKSPTKKAANLPETSGEYTVKDVPPPNGTEEIREAAEAVNAANAPAPEETPVKRATPRKATARK